jgi:hypothetical protein
MLKKYNKLNERIKGYFGKNTRKEVKLRTNNIIAKQTVQFGSETWVVRQEHNRRIEA